MDPFEHEVVVVWVWEPLVEDSWWPALILAWLQGLLVASSGTGVAQQDEILLPATALLETLLKEQLETGVNKKR